ncbi:MAG: DUF6491 family protein [Xanthomonadales bacterium]|nr:DUF6491 family protein [Xanthomonadales bacterium]
MKNILAITLISILLLGYSSVNSMSLKEKDVAYSNYVIDENLASKDKITGFKFNNYKALSDNYLIITDLSRGSYLVEIKSRCSNLSYSRGIKINRFSNMSISSRGDSISLIGNNSLVDSVTPGVRGSISPRGSIASGQCLIKSIHPITKDQTDYLVAIGKPVQIEG